MSTINKGSLFHKVKFIIREFRKEIFFILMLLLIGMVFEMASIGIIIPTLGILLSPNIHTDFPSVLAFFQKYGFETQKDIVLLAMYVMVGVYFLKTIFMLYLSWKQANFSADLSARTSSKLYSVYLGQPYSFHLLRNSSELIRNVIGEVHEFSEMLKAVFVLLIELTAMLGITIILLIQEPVGTLIIFIIFGASTLLLQRVTKKKLLNWGERRQYHDGLMKKKLTHGLLGIKDIKLKGTEKVFLDEFNEHNFQRVSVVSKQYALTFFPRLYLEFVAVLGLVGYIIFKLYVDAPLNSLLPTIAIFIAGAFRMIPSANRIIGSMQYIRYSIPVIEVLYNELLFSAKFAPPLLNATNDIQFTDRLVLKNINYTYPGSDSQVLTNISINISKGETIGFIGTSGSGKSTLVDIILGLLTPTRGSMEVDGKEMNEDIKSWQKLVGYVPQTIFLTDDTIRNNIAFGIRKEDIDEEAVNTALVAAQLISFTKSLPQGLDTCVGEQGVRLSGGQRQRIGLARALYYDPEMLVLDEATSALDLQTESFVMDTVLKLRGKKTILLVAHRLSTLRNCDRIFKLENGVIVQEDVPEKIL